MPSLSPLIPTVQTDIDPLTSQKATCTESLWILICRFTIPYLLRLFKITTNLFILSWFVSYKCMSIVIKHFCKLQDDFEQPSFNWIHHKCFTFCLKPCLLQVDLHKTNSSTPSAVLFVFPYAFVFSDHFTPTSLSSSIFQPIRGFGIKLNSLFIALFRFTTME